MIAVFIAIGTCVFLMGLIIFIKENFSTCLDDIPCGAYMLIGLTVMINALIHHLISTTGAN